MEGFLFKKGRAESGMFGRRNWKKRWFVLDGTYLTYYEQFDLSTGKPKNKKGVVPVLGCECRPIPHHAKKFTFILKHAQRKPVVMLAPDDKMMHLWISALTAAATGQNGPSDINFNEYFEALGLKMDDCPTSSEINRAYRKAALKVHPDKGGDILQFKKIQEAYDILTNKLEEEELEKLYDNIVYEAVIQKGPQGVGLGLIVAEDAKKGIISIKEVLPSMMLVSTSECAGGKMLPNDRLVMIGDDDVALWPLARVVQRLGDFRCPIGSKLQLKFLRKVRKDGQEMDDDDDDHEEEGASHHDNADDAQNSVQEGDDTDFNFENQNILSDSDGEGLLHGYDDIDEDVRDDHDQWNDEEVPGGDDEEAEFQRYQSQAASVSVSAGRPAQQQQQQQQQQLPHATTGNYQDEDYEDGDMDDGYEGAAQQETTSSHDVIMSVGPAASADNYSQQSQQGYDDNQDDNYEGGDDYEDDGGGDYEGNNEANGYYEDAHQGRDNYNRGNSHNNLQPLPQSAVKARMPAATTDNRFGSGRSVNYDEYVACRQENDGLRDELDAMRRDFDESERRNEDTTMQYQQTIQEVAKLKAALKECKRREEYLDLQLQQVMFYGTVSGDQMLQSMKDMLSISSQVKSGNSIQIPAEVDQYLTAIGLSQETADHNAVANAQRSAVSAAAMIDASGRMLRKWAVSGETCVSKLSKLENRLQRLEGSDIPQPPTPSSSFGLDQHQPSSRRQQQQQQKQQQQPIRRSRNPEPMPLQRPTGSRLSVNNGSANVEPNRRAVISLSSGGNRAPPPPAVGIRRSSKSNQPTDRQ